MDVHLGVADATALSHALLHQSYNSATSNVHCYLSFTICRVRLAADQIDDSGPFIELRALGDTSVGGLVHTSIRQDGSDHILPNRDLVFAVVERICAICGVAGGLLYRPGPDLVQPRHELAELRVLHQLPILRQPGGGPVIRIVAPVKVVFLSVVDDGDAVTQQEEGGRVLRNGPIRVGGCYARHVLVLKEDAVKVAVDAIVAVGKNGGGELLHRFLALVDECVVCDRVERVVYQSTTAHCILQGVLLGGNVEGFANHIYAGSGCCGPIC